MSTAFGEFKHHSFPSGVSQNLHLFKCAFFFPPLTKYCVIECFLLCSSVTWKTVVALPAFSESPVLLWAAQGAGCLPGDCSRSVAQDRLELCRLNQALLSEASEC